MLIWPATAALRELEEGGVMVLDRAETPLDELLLTLHETRFTGALELSPQYSASSDSGPLDRILFREGGAVGVVPPYPEDLRLLSESLIQLKLIDHARMTNLLRQHSDADGLRMGQRLLAMGILDRETLDRAYAEQARRRVFQLYDIPGGQVAVREGMGRLAAFHPIFVDLRPAIAYGMVVRAAPERRAAIAEKAAGQKCRLLVPYDEQRNSYGLPPPVLAGLRCLAEDEIVFDRTPVLPGLSKDETAGILLLLDRMSLINFSA